MVSRRLFLSGALASLAGPVFANAPAVSSFPRRRPDGFHLRSLPSGEDLISSANLGGRVAYVVADAYTGQVLETVNPVLGMPPASVAKSMTAAYGLDRMGPGYRFRTTVVSNGTLTNGRLEGDLWLVGSGDPLLDTDHLNDLTRALAEAGLREVTGQFRVVDTALPHIREIAPDQPIQVGYNPAVGGLNLNFNRVHFEWQRSGDGYNLQMDARSAAIRPPVMMAEVRLSDSQPNVYSYGQTDAAEVWTVARRALGQNGARWLPVRRPAAYAADVFRVLARSRGIVLTPPEFGAVPPVNGLVLAEHVSDPLEEILRGMMRWSTNLTAEVVGLMASQAGGGAPSDLAGSAAMMNSWMSDRLGARHPGFVDHSGLGATSRINTREMVRSLVATGANGGLRRIMRDIAMRDAQGSPVADHPVEVVAKTGTLYFVSTLAGFARAPSGRDLAFAIFCGDLDRRSQFDSAQEQRPPGARTYNRAAKQLQQALIERWAAVYETA